MVVDCLDDRTSTNLSGFSGNLTLRLKASCLQGLVPTPNGAIQGWHSIQKAMACKKSRCLQGACGNGRQCGSAHLGYRAWLPQIWRGTSRTSKVLSMGLIAYNILKTLFLGKMTYSSIPATCGNGSDPAALQSRSAMDMVVDVRSRTQQGQSALACRTLFFHALLRPARVVWRIENMTAKSPLQGAARAGFCGASCGVALWIEVGRTLTSLRTLPREWAV
jgi:hypothetical protein